MRKPDIDKPAKRLSKTEFKEVSFLLEELEVLSSFTDESVFEAVVSRIQRARSILEERKPVEPKEPVEEIDTKKVIADRLQQKLAQLDEMLGDK
jgi:hypothetical protein